LFFVLIVIFFFAFQIVFKNLKKKLTAKWIRKEDQAFKSKLFP